MDSTSLPEGGEPRKCGHFHFYGLIAVVRLVRFGSIKGKWQKMRKDSRGKKGKVYLSSDRQESVVIYVTSWGYKN